MIAKNIMKHLLVKILFISFLSSSIPPHSYNDWEILQDNKIWVGYTQTDFTWCKSSSIFNYSIDEILEIVEDIENYYVIFDSIVSSSKNKDDVIHIMVDYPIPLSDRDYVVKFYKLLEDNTTIYRFHSDSSFNIPINDNYIRLNNAAGEWRLVNLKNGQTKVSYTWNGELKGMLPLWIYKRAWLKQGNEIMINLEERLANK